MALAAEPVAVAPPLKWAGGKRWLIPHLLPFWEEHRHRRLVEPFVGGLAVVLGLRPQSALLNDANPHLISFYRWLQRSLDVRALNVPMENNAETFARNRTRFNALIAQNQAHTAEAAALFYYLNRTCYNGLSRFNSRGFFNVPFGRHNTINYRGDFSEYSAILQHYEFSTGSFEEIALVGGDFVYADPPYDVEFTSYSTGGFTWSDQGRLAEWLAKHDGPVIASNQATARVLSLYGSLGFSIKTIPGPRRISCTGNRDPASEMFATLNL